MPTVVLLPTGMWQFDPRLLSADVSNLYPPLAALVDGTIDAWLEAKTLPFQLHIHTHLAYIIQYVDHVREPEFIESLYKRHHRFFWEYLNIL